MPAIPPDTRGITKKVRAAMRERKYRKEKPSPSAAAEPDDDDDDDEPEEYDPTRNRPKLTPEQGRRMKKMAKNDIAKYRRRAEEAEAKLKQVESERDELADAADNWRQYEHRQRHELVNRLPPELQTRDVKEMPLNVLQTFVERTAGVPKNGTTGAATGADLGGRTPEEVLSDDNASQEQIDAALSAIESQDES